MKFLFYIFLILNCCLSFAQQWHKDFNAALKEAKTKELPIFINFSGSDWCKPCMRFTKEVLTNEQFLQFSKDNLVLFNADYPRKPIKNKNLVQQYDSLSEIYNPNGYFPTNVLINYDGKLIKHLGSESLPVDEYIQLLKNLLPKKTSSLEQPLKKYVKSTRLMGVGFEFALLTDSHLKAETAFNKAIEKIKNIEHLISSWDSTSQTTQINKNAGIQAVKVDYELYALIKRSLKISALTNGYFDISVIPLFDTWNFYKSQHAIPDSSQIRNTLALVNYKQIILNDKDTSVFLSKKGMKIGFGAIGKGYAANEVKKLWLDMGIKNGMVNASGDLIIWGENDKIWNIGIADPDKKTPAIGYLTLNNTAIVTSGNYEKYIEINGKIYPHIFNPKTGYPVLGIKSVTIICPDAEIADALATSVFVMGKQKGLDLINQLKNIEAVIIDENDEMVYSKNIAPVRVN